MIVDGVEDDPYYSFLKAFKNNKGVNYNSVTSKCTLKIPKVVLMKLNLFNFLKIME